MTYTLQAINQKATQMIDEKGELFCPTMYASFSDGMMYISFNKSSLNNSQTFYDVDSPNNDDPSGDYIFDDKVYPCKDLLGEKLINFLQDIFNIIKIVAIVGFIVLSMLEFSKGITKNDKEIMQKSFKKTIIRLLIVILIFMLPTLVNLVMNLLGYSGSCGIR